MSDSIIAILISVLVGASVGLAVSGIISGWLCVSLACCSVSLVLSFYSFFKK